MNTDSVFIYCLVSEIVKSFNISDDPQCKMSTPEVITFVVIASLYYQCNYHTARIVSKSHKLFPSILSHSRLVRRIHQVPEKLWLVIFETCREILSVKKSREYIIDSFPVAACETHKSFRCKLFGSKKYHGYTASKKRYFFGIKVHMITDMMGIPIEFVFTEGSKSDVKTLNSFNFCLPAGSTIYADKAYTNYNFEDLLKEHMDIHLLDPDCYLFSASAFYRGSDTWVRDE